MSLRALRGRLLLAFCAVVSLMSAGAPSFARTEADEKTGRYVLACDSAGGGKPEAVYECALASTIKAGVISNGVAAACRTDAAGATARFHHEVWECAKLRQFGAGLPQKEWQSATMNDCHRRAARPGHRYQGNNHQCAVDAIVEQKRAPPERIAACQSQKQPSAHFMLNCMLREQPTAGASPALSPRQRAEAQRAAGPDAAALRLQECRDYASRQRADAGFINRCQRSSETPEAVLAAMQGERAQNDRARVDADRAAYPPAKVRNDVRGGCDGHNRSSSLQFDCACVRTQADRHLAEGRLSPRAVAEMQFDLVPCIERRRTADKMMASFGEANRKAAKVAPFDVEARNACQHRAIEQEIDAASLMNLQRVTAEISRRCPPRPQPAR